MNLKKTILTIFFIQILAVAGNRVFAQDCGHWLKIVVIDKNNYGFLKLLDDDGREVQSIQIPPGSDAAKAAGIIEQQLIAYKIITCFKRVGQYLCVDNVKHYSINGALDPPGYKLVEVSRPNFVPKVDSVIVTADRETHHILKKLEINSDTEMYDGYTINPVGYGPQEPPFGQPSERKTNWWEYKVRFETNQFGAPWGVYVRCSTSDADANHFITVKLKMKKLILKE